VRSRSSRTDLLAKLCEIYFVWGNRDAFVDAAERFKGLLDGADDPEWDKTVIMGQQIAADHALFSEAQGATKAVDLSFDDDGDAELDMDFAAGPGAGDEVIDLGAEDGPDTSATGTNSALDFVFDDEDSGSTGRHEAGSASNDDFEDAFADAASETAEMPAMDDVTAEMPTVESPLDDRTAETPTIEQQFDADATGELPAIGDDEATRIASLDDRRPPPESDATAEIDLDDLGLDLDGMQDDFDDDDSLGDLSSPAERKALDFDDLDATGSNEDLGDSDPTGRNRAVEDDDRSSDLLEATGQTQILPEDFAVETGTGTNIDRALSEDDATRLASLDDDDDRLSDDAETLLAALDDDDDDTDFDFARTEALPKESLHGNGAAPGSTDMDLDLDDLTAALKLSATGDTIDQKRDDATLEQPRPSAGGDYDSDTEALGPEEFSDVLHDARTMTEVGTKLDLARAYVDMGDPGGARSILEEVLDEGDESQRQQAQQLLDSLPA